MKDRLVEKWKGLIKWLDSGELKMEDERVWIKLIAKACELSETGTIPMWTDGSELLVSEENLCNALADALDRTWDDHPVRTSHYDPAEDLRSGEVDRYTGWWCIDFV